MRAPISALLLSLMLVACGDKDGETGDSGASASSGACELAAETAACPECADGDVTCSYGDESATEMSCGDCQARSALYSQLCDAGVTDAKADIEAGTECVPAE